MLLHIRSTAASFFLGFRTYSTSLSMGQMTISIVCGELVMLFYPQNFSALRDDYTEFRSNRKVLYYMELNAANR
jgi:hypothetical protein